MTTPSNLKFMTTDEWVKVEGKVCTVGISDYAQNQLSDIVFVEIEVEVGDQVKKNSVGATIESVKAAVDVNIPISGKVVEINQVISQTPEVINSDPYVTAWLFKVEMANPAELDILMDATTYDKYCGERSH
jgi:glycine cleavage system H protein